MRQLHQIKESVTNSLRIQIQITSLWRVESQNEDQTQAPISSGTDNDEVFKHRHITEVIKHMSNLPRVAPIRCRHRRPKGRNHMYK
jgi:hypothetical protein